MKKRSAGAAMVINMVLGFILGTFFGQGVKTKITSIIEDAKS